MITAQLIEQAFGLANVTLEIAAGRVRVIAGAEPAPDHITAAVQAWHDAGRAPTQGEIALSAARSQMADILDALPLSVQASLWATRVAVEQALDRGRLDIARQIVADTAVPAELDPTKAAILGLFPSA